MNLPIWFRRARLVLLFYKGKSSIFATFASPCQLANLPTPPKIYQFKRWNPHWTVSNLQIWGINGKFAVCLIFLNPLSFSHRPEPKKKKTEEQT